MRINPIKSYSLKANYGNSLVFGRGISNKKGISEKNISYPQAQVSGQCVKYSDIIKFHNDIAKSKDRDKISYDFYTTPMYFKNGGNFSDFPSEAPHNSIETLSEMKKEFNRLLSDKSKLSSDEKRLIGYLDEKAGLQIKHLKIIQALDDFVPSWISNIK